eukprot:6204972-Pleurochrysis_carterae.AAC.1
MPSPRPRQARPGPVVRCGAQRLRWRRLARASAAWRRRPRCPPPASIQCPGSPALCPRSSHWADYPPPAAPPPLLAGRRRAATGSPASPAL